jgi:hypothetical protein
MTMNNLDSTPPNSVNDKGLPRSGIFCAVVYSKFTTTSLSFPRRRPNQLFGVVFCISSQMTFTHTAAAAVAVVKIMTDNVNVLLCFLC